MPTQDQLPDLEGRSTYQVTTAIMPKEAFSVPEQSVPFYLATLRSAQQLLRVHPALGLTIGYLFLTTVGMIYEVLFFGRFGLLIFDFAEPSDFLLVALREPVLLVFTLLSVLVLVRLIRKHARWLARSERYRRISEWFKSKSWWELAVRICSIGFVIGYFVALTWMWAEYRSGSIQSGNGRKVHVELASEAAIKSEGQPAKSYIILGSTSRYLLLFNPVSRHTEIVPVNNIARLISAQ